MLHEASSSAHEIQKAEQRQEAGPQDLEGLSPRLALYLEFSATSPVACSWFVPSGHREDGVLTEDLPPSKGPVGMTMGHLMTDMRGSSSLWVTPPLSKVALGLSKKAG